MAPLDGSLFLSASVVSLPLAQAPPVVPYDGYGSASVFARLPREVVDAGVDGEGWVSGLLWERVGERSIWRVQRLTPEGRMDASWPVELPPGQSPFSMLVEPGGDALVVFQHTVQRYDRNGHRVGAWDSPWDTSTSDMALWGDGGLVVSFPSLNMIALFARDGTLQQQLKQFEGTPGKFYLPRAVAVSPQNDLVVIQDDGTAIVFQNPDDQWRPTFVRTFRVDFGVLPLNARGAVFDGPDRLLVPDPSAPTPLVYNLQGQRLMAAIPERDLSQKGMGPFHLFRLATDRLYAVDRFSNAIWSIGR